MTWEKNYPKSMPYTSSGEERVVEIPGFPPMSIGASLEICKREGDRFVIVYLLDNPEEFSPTGYTLDQLTMVCPMEPPEEGADPVEPEGTPETSEIGVAVFIGVRWFEGTGFNDEALGFHPLEPYGLGFYTLNLVHGSTLAEAQGGGSLRHFVMTFKEDSLEVVAESVHVAFAKIPSRLTRDKAGFRVRYIDTKMMERHVEHWLTADLSEWPAVDLAQYP